MPNYDYRCDACKHKFEQYQSIKAGPIRKCPACGKLKVKRVIGGGAGILFKGTGFYQTDYRSKSYSDGASKDAPKSSSSDKPASAPTTPAPASPAKGSGKSDSK